MICVRCQTEQQTAALAQRVCCPRREFSNSLLPPRDRKASGKADGNVLLG
ncbi:hypothetical protein PANA5342_3685 [Pantoea ananatis LMG 5342]|nr:hypothetical protein PANA5342_3685 [Pantoea ananatis LMG 5342]